MLIKKLLIVFSLVIVPQTLLAQDILPEDNGLATYHTSPRYRESESHPFRILAYALHPIGWLAREVVFRPFSYFASSTETTRSIMGYREPYDYRQPECFSADDSVPDCRAVSPFNYDALPAEAMEPEPADLSLAQEPVRQVYFPDVNFDFDVRALNDLGRGRAHQIAALLEHEPGLKIVLEGHADFIGSETYNEKLGMDRSEAVRQQLVSLGVSAERLSSVTFGKSQPALTEKEDWARAVNRRVEIHVDDSAAVVEEPAEVKAE
ncbi:OmpA family protein [Oligoflexia bacterium]|nr:OmpA family protein [Oligoflexia bacterium]